MILPLDDSTDQSPVPQHELRRFFKDAADRIEGRAKQARRRGTVLAVGFFVGAYALIVIGVFRVTDITSMPYPRPTVAASVDATMQARLAALVSDARMVSEHSTPEDLAYINRQQAQLQENLAVWQRMRQIAPPERADVPDWYSSRGMAKVLSIVFLAVLAGVAIRVALMFWSYYARLAEFFDTQVDALRLSDGNADMAVEFMRHFSPNVIGLGPMPKAMQEAVADALSAVAKRA